MLTPEPAVLGPATSSRAAAVRPSVWRRIGRPGAFALGVVALLMVVIAGLAVGARDVDPVTVIRALLGQETGTGATIVRELRLPRTLLGIAVGAALGLAGMLMQGVTRNPVADPGILGVSAGAALAVVLSIAVLGVQDATGHLGAALVGAAIASIAVYGLGAAGGGRLSPLRLTLAGAVMTAFLGAISSAILVTDEATLANYRFWEAGSLASRDLAVLGAVLPTIIVGTVIALGLARALDALSLGDDVAIALGQRVFLVRIVAAVGIVLLAGSAVAAAGPIVFVGLAVPHAARAITGQDGRWIAAWCLLLGPMLLVGADVLGRIVLRPSELQVGIVTALVGVPIFVLLVRRRRLPSR